MGKKKEKKKLKMEEFEIKFILYFFNNSSVSQIHC
jgi:hypothetical protein